MNFLFIEHENWTTFKINHKRKFSLFAEIKHITRKKQETTANQKKKKNYSKNNQKKNKTMFQSEQKRNRNFFYLFNRLFVLLTTKKKKKLKRKIPENFDFPIVCHPFLVHFSNGSSLDDCLKWSCIRCCYCLSISVHLLQYAYSITQNESKNK